MNPTPLFEKKAVSPLFFLGLIFLFFPFYYAQFSDYSLVIVLATLLFAGMYCSILYSEHTLYQKCAWTYMVVYIVWMSFWGNIQFSLFLFNLSNLISWRFMDARWNFRTVSYALCLASVVIWGLLGPFSFELRAFVLIIHSFGLALLFANLSQARKEAMEKKLQEKNQSINFLLAENERNRIGQDLHDTLGHVFAMLSVKADLVHALLEREQIQQAKKEVVDLQEVTRTAMQEVRGIVQSLKQPQLTDEVQIIQQMLSLAGVTCGVEGVEQTRSWSQQVQTNLSMVVRELANNLLKHSQARNCRLCFAADDDQLLLVYEDDGCGFSEVTGEELHTIKERLGRIGGSMTFRSLARPTCIELSIPKGGHTQ